MDRRLLFSSSRESSSHHQQSQPPLSAEELLKNILLRGSGTTNNPVTTIPLPSKLFSILANKELEHIVSWLPQGRAWRIHNVEMFAQRLLPLFCNNNIGPSSVNKNLRAFTSQLEAWGFRELSRGPNSLAYYSEVSPCLRSLCGGFYVSRPP